MKFTVQLLKKILALAAVAAAALADDSEMSSLEGLDANELPTNNAENPFMPGSRQLDFATDSHDEKLLEELESLAKRKCLCSPTITCVRAGGRCVRSNAKCNGVLDVGGCKGRKCSCCISNQSTPAPTTCPDVTCLAPTTCPTVTCPSVTPCPTTAATPCPSLTCPAVTPCPTCFLSCDDTNIQANIARPKARKLVEDGGLTLAFVFDNTGSMGSDLKQVKDGAKKILNATLESPDSHIQNFILVTFNDPAVGLITETTDPAEFEKSINDIVVSGGGDCPEMALGGMKMALEAVLPYSLIYVFTDASAKDKYELDAVITLIQEKHAQVDVLMTGPNCGETTDTTYETITSISSGQVYTINKGDVTTILDYITVFVSSEKVTLITFEFDAGENNFALHVDFTLKEFTVSVSGTNPFIQIIGPGGEDLEAIGKVEVFVDLDNVKIAGVKDPTPGIHSVNVSSDAKYTVRVKGDTSISFEYGFSLTPTANFYETSLRPLAGETAYIIIKPTDLTDFGDFYRIKMITKNKTIVHDSSLKLVPGYDSIYNGTYFIPSEEPFQIKIFGCDQTYTEFERLSASYISALYPDISE